MPVNKYFVLNPSQIVRCSGFSIYLTFAMYVHICRCLESSSTSKFLILCVWLRWCDKRTRGLYWFEQNVPMSSSLLLLVLLALKVHSRGYKRSREGLVPSLWWCVVVSSDSSRVELRCVRMPDRSSNVICPLMGRPAFPFIGQGKARVIMGEKRRTRGRGSPSGSPVKLLIWF